MNRIFHSVLVIASLMLFEGVSLAETTAVPRWASVGKQAASPVATRESPSVAPPSEGTRQAQFDLSELARMDSDMGAAGYSSSPSTDDSLAGLRLCHISRHPRDGVRSEIHACPLLVADSDATLSPAQDRSAANASGSSQVD